MRASGRSSSKTPRRLRLTGCRAAFAALLVPGAAWAQAGPAPAGSYVELEAQAVLGASDFEAGYLPSLTGPSIGRPLNLDEGNGWGGALTFGYAWHTGWKAAVRYRRLDTDDSGGPILPGVIVFLPGVANGAGLPDGIPFPLLDARTSVESETTIVDLEVGKDIGLAGGGSLHLFGGLTYTSIERDVTLIDAMCGCTPLALMMANDFQGLGPKIGLRGSVPLGGSVRLVGGTSAALLLGTATFASRLSEPLLPASFKDEDDRAVAVIDGEAGLAFAAGPGTLTVGYRIEAMLDALDTDQRVPDEFASFGFPGIGDRHDDVIRHGPFARFKLPLSAAGD